MKKQNLKIAIVQQTCSTDAKQNLQHCLDGIRHAAEQKADVVLLQELHNYPYFCQYEDDAHFDLAESIPGPTTNQLMQAAKQHQLVIIGSIFERHAAGHYHNTAVVCDRDGRLAGCYRKMHIPNDPGYYEKYYFTPGDQGFKPIDTSIGKLGVLICWDQWYPEAARLMALQGAELLLYPTAIGWDPSDNESEKKRQLESWITIQRSHAIANALPVVSCNRTGFEADKTQRTEGIEFWGHSFICGPQGEVILQCDSEETGVRVAEIDLEKTEEVRQVWPFLRDRRIDAYQAICQRFGK